MVSSARLDVGALMVSDREPPPAPADLTARVGARSDVELDWAAVDANDLAGYRVRWGTAPGAYVSSLEVSKTTTSTRVAGLIEGGRYYFVVHAFDAQGNESAPSNEVVADPHGYHGAAGGGRSSSRPCARPGRRRPGRGGERRVLRGVRRGARGGRESRHELDLAASVGGRRGVRGHRAQSAGRDRAGRAARTARFSRVLPRGLRYRSLFGRNAVDSGGRSPPSVGARWLAVGGVRERSGIPRPHSRRRRLRASLRLLLRRPVGSAGARAGRRAEQLASGVHGAGG